MKRKKIWLSLLLTLVVMTAALCGCAPQSMEERLQGRWLFEENMESGFELYDDGEGIGFSDPDLDSVSISWNATEDRLRFYSLSEDEQIIFKIEDLSGNRLVLSTAGETLNLVREGDMPSGAAAFLDGISPWMIIICGIIAVLAILLVIIIISAVHHARKGKKTQPLPHPVSPVTPQPPVSPLSDKTELVGEDDYPNQSGPAPMLILTDLSNPSKRFGAPVRGTIAIGRDISVCRIAVNYDPSVARHQCDVFMENGELMIQNRSNSNITQVDGQRVEGKCPLRSGSVLKMGRVQMQVEVVQNG